MRGSDGSIETRGCGSPATESGPLGRVGRLVAGRYRLVEVVGHGATAQVWRARDELLHRAVAVKWFHDREAYPMAEARLGASVRHPNVVAVHDLVCDHGSWCLVMDDYVGGDLASTIRKRGALEPPVAAAVGLRLLDALQAAHAAGVLHCDVKPANVLLGDAGEVALTDFGIAELSGRASPVHPHRRDGMVVGSPGYVAPELLRGDPPSPASDLWSLGATLYTAVEGRSPYAEDDTVQAALAVLREPPPEARRAGALTPLLRRLLVKQPQWRPSYDAVRALLGDVRPAPRGPDVAGSAAEIAPAEPATITLAATYERFRGQRRGA